MKNNIIRLVMSFVIITTLCACDDYLDNIPKGEKVPTTFADFNAMLNYESGCHSQDAGQTIILMNDRFVSSSLLNYYGYWKANYMWDETADRIDLNNSYEMTYYYGYGIISTVNLVIENVEDATDGTAEEKKILMAQAKTLRADAYFFLLNYYSKTYNPTTSATDGGIPIITSAEVNAPYTQMSVKECYEFILNDINDALPNLPEKSQNILYPTIGTGYALAARVYLQMQNYEKALEYAEKALSINNQLFDWNEFYEANKSVMDVAGSYQTTASPMGYDFCENYNFTHGAVYYSTTEYQIRLDRAAKFEEGDRSLKCRWKYRKVGENEYYQGILSGYYNRGLTTTEIYLIKAECLARLGDVDNAIKILNTVRKKRINPSIYQDKTANTAAEAIKLINRTKSDALLMSYIPFCDRRRLNLESSTAETFTKTEGGVNYTLSPTSSLWTFPFPLGAVKISGNGSVTQNVEK